MTIDDLIEKLEEIREAAGGKTEVICRREVWPHGTWKATEPEFKLTTHLDDIILFL